GAGLADLRSADDRRYLDTTLAGQALEEGEGRGADLGPLGTVGDVGAAAAHVLQAVVEVFLHPHIVAGRSSGLLPSAPLSEKNRMKVLSYSPVFFRWSMTRPIWWSMLSTMEA